MKDCRINLQICRTGSENLLIPFGEGVNEDVLDIVLGAGQGGDDASDAGYEKASGNPACAIMNVCGNLSDGSEDLWRDGDLKMKLVFRYYKAQ